MSTFNARNSNVGGKSVHYYKCDSNMLNSPNSCVVTARLNMLQQAIHTTIRKKAYTLNAKFHMRKV